MIMLKCYFVCINFHELEKMGQFPMDLNLRVIGIAHYDASYFRALDIYQDI